MSNSIKNYPIIVLITSLLLIATGLGSSSFSQIVPLNVTLDREAVCQDLSATRKGITVSFIIEGLYHFDNTYRSEIRGPDGNIIIDEQNGLPVQDDLSRLIPSDAPNPATTFLGKAFATLKFGTFSFVVLGSDGSEASLSFAVPQCPPIAEPTIAEQIHDLIQSIQNDGQISDHAEKLLVNKLDKALSALTDEKSTANNKKLTCNFLDSSLSSLKALEKSRQINAGQASEIGQQIVSIKSNLNC